MNTVVRCRCIRSANRPTVILKKHIRKTEQQRFIEHSFRCNYSPTSVGSGKLKMPDWKLVRHPSVKLPQNYKFITSLKFKRKTISNILFWEEVKTLSVAFHCSRPINDTLINRIPHCQNVFTKLINVLDLTLVQDYVPLL